MITEARLDKLESEIKSLKSSMPVAGLLVDTYAYSATSSATYQDGVRAYYTVKFKPTFPEKGLGLTELFVYQNGNTSDERWSQYNPIGCSMNNGYYVDIDKSARRDLSYSYSGFGEYEISITAFVYSTVPGEIEITFN